jgi:NAD(P)H-dependent FMN reductase
MNIPPDKQLHILGGAAVSGLFDGIFLGSGPLAGAIAGALKEGYDWVANKIAGAQVHTVDPYDFLATFAGALAETGLRILVLKAAAVVLPFVVSAFA